MESFDKMKMHVSYLKQTQEIIDYIEAHLLEHLTPEQIAKKFFISVSLLNMAFGFACNISVMEYVRNRRLSMAGRELLLSNEPIIEIALHISMKLQKHLRKLLHGSLVFRQVMSDERGWKFPTLNQSGSESKRVEAGSQK